MAAPIPENGWKDGRSRYRIDMRNASDDIHPTHLHRHSFELVSLGADRRNLEGPSYWESLSKLR